MKHTREILSTPSRHCWTTRWLSVLKQANEEGFHPKIPQFGFGDATSYKLIEKVVEATKDSGAVRHGAECFNFTFPQELDENYLVVWEGYTEKQGKPWDYLDEKDLRTFLLERISDGFAFPLNPVWPVRDPGWWTVWQSLLADERAQGACRSWYPPESGLIEAIQDIHV